MATGGRAISHPVFWSSLIFVLGVAATLSVASQEKVFLEANPQFTPPQVSAVVPLAYFLGAVLALGIVLFLIPVSKLRWVIKILFAGLYAWGIFVATALTLPIIPAATITVVVSLVWYLWPRVWLQNLVMLFAMVSVGAVFGRLLSPWTVLIVLAALSVYDILSVQFGYMLWLVGKLSESDTLPAFVIPKQWSNWNLGLRSGDLKRLLQAPWGEREFSILGGGDIGFPLLLVASVFLNYRLVESLVVAASALLGLISAYAIQRFFLKGKPMPALPPICFTSAIGFLVVFFITRA
jgi:presenilin-like A22 family membrane protease